MPETIEKTFQEWDNFSETKGFERDQILVL
jgi:hypothetical protein